MPAAIQSFILLIAIFAFMYFLVIRPQRRRQIEALNLQKSLGPGDEVVTISGIYGTITEVEDGGTVLVEVSQDTEIRMAAAAISQVIKDSGEVPTHDVSVASTPE